MGSPSKLPTHVHQFWSTPKPSKMGNSMTPCSLQWLLFWFHVFLLLVGWSSSNHTSDKDCKHLSNTQRTLRDHQLWGDSSATPRDEWAWRLGKKKTISFDYLVWVLWNQSKTSLWILGVFLFGHGLSSKKTRMNSQRVLNDVEKCGRNQTKWRISGSPVVGGWFRFLIKPLECIKYIKCKLQLTSESHIRKTPPMVFVFVVPLYKIWVFPKMVGVSPKMDGENNGKPY